jgi:hypothetical protein
MRFARSCLAAVAVTAAFAVATPAASAQVVPGVPGFGGDVAGPCAHVNSGPDTGVPGVAPQVCGAGLVFIGPSVGRIASVVGPTIISPGFVGAVGVGAGSVFIGPGAGGNNGP